MVNKDPFDDPMDPLDPLGLSRAKQPQKQEEKPVDEFAPVLPPNLGIAPANTVGEDKKNILSHQSLREENVPEDRRLNLPEMNLPANITEQQKELVENAVKDVVLFGAEASAMVCEGDRCPYAKKCPLLRNSIPVPVGSECPIELYAMRTWMQAQLRELGINPHDVGSFYDVVASQAMTGLMLQMHRAKWGEALNPLLEQTMENIVQSGNKTITNIIKTGNFNTDYREKAIKALEKMAKSNMQTRERKTALTQSGWKDLSKHAAEVSERIAHVREVEEKVSGTDERGLPIALSRVKRFVDPDEEKKKT